MIEVPNIEKKVPSFLHFDRSKLNKKKKYKKDPHKSLNLLHKVLAYGYTFCADNTIHVNVCTHRKKDK